MRWRSATYSVPLLKTTPFGASRSVSSTFASRLPPLSTTAYISFSWRVPTNTVPLSPKAIERAPGMPSAHTSTLKPDGTLSLLIGRSLEGLPVISIANGCSVDSDIAGGLPCCQDGGGAAAGLSCACAAVNAARTAAATTALMISSSQEELLELKACLDASAHVAPRRGLEIAEVGLVHDHGPDIVAVGEVVDAGEFAEAPARALLDQPGRQVPHRKGRGEIGIGVAHRHFRAMQRFDARMQRRAAIAQLAVELVPRHDRKRRDGRYGNLGRRGGNRRLEAFAERSIEIRACS